MKTKRTETKKTRRVKPKEGDIVLDSGGCKFAVVKATKGATFITCMDPKDKEVLMKNAAHLTVIGKVSDAQKTSKQAHDSQQRTIRRHEVHRDAIHRSHFGKTNGPY